MLLPLGQKIYLLGMLEYCTQVITTCDGDTGEISVAFDKAPTAEELAQNGLKIRWLMYSSLWKH